MGVICKYKFDSSIYADLIPEFNSGYSGYVITDEVEGNIITRTIESDELPTLMKFGTKWSGTDNSTNREKSLLSVFDINMQELNTGYCMFYRCSNLTDVTSSIISAKMKTIANMFQHCTKIKSIDIILDTSNVTDMNSMFSGCNNLASLDVSNWDTSNVTRMDYMFSDCNKLTSLDVSNWNTSNVTDMRCAFRGCKLLTSLDVSNFDTSNVNYMHGMFQNCTKLTALDVSNFNTSNVTNMGSMFYNCSKLTSLDLSGFDTSNVTDTTNMFANTNSLEVITMFNSDINTINTIGNLTSATIYVDESLDQSQYTGTAPLKVYKEEKLEIKLNSPLLEGDTIEVKDGKLCHVHRWDSMILDDNSNWVYFTTNFPTVYAHIDFKKAYADNSKQCVFCENILSEKGSSWSDNSKEMIYIWKWEDKQHENSIYLQIYSKRLPTEDFDGFKQYLSQNPLTIIYKLAEPYYEDITPLQSSIVLKTFLESSMTIDTNLPIETKLSYRTNVPSISTLSTRATELAESDNVIHNLMNIIDDEVDE